MQTHFFSWAGPRHAFWERLAAALLVLAAWALRPGAARAQSEPPTVRVSGTVSAAGTRGQPVPGATVQVRRTRRGTVADAQGDFALQARPTDTLVFRAVGYKPHRLLLGGTSLSALVVQVALVRDSVQLGEVRVTADRPDRALINRALRNMKRPAPPVARGVKRPPKPKPLFPVDSTAPKAPVPTLESPISLIYDQFSREGKQRRKMEEIRAAEEAEKARQARTKYNKVFRDNRGYE